MATGAIKTLKQILIQCFNRSESATPPCSGKLYLIQKKKHLNEQSTRLLFGHET